MSIFFPRRPHVDKCSIIKEASNNGFNYLICQFDVEAYQNISMQRFMELKEVLTVLILQLYHVAHQSNCNVHVHYHITLSSLSNVRKMFQYYKTLRLINRFI